MDKSVCACCGAEYEVAVSEISAGALASDSAPCEFCGWHLKEWDLAGTQDYAFRAVAKPPVT